MTVPDPVEVARKLTESQREWLYRVCATNGGGARIACKVGDDGYGIPTNRAVLRLWELDLIQGKSGGYETVVHTPLGLSVRAALQQDQQP